MKTRYDDEIREVEQRLVLERQALAQEARELALRARDAAGSPKGLLAAFAIGFVVGELTAPRKRRQREIAAATTKKLGLGGLIGSALVAYVRSQYGSPMALARRAWEYYVAFQRARRTATRRSYAPPARRYTEPTVAKPGAVPAPSAAPTEPQVSAGGTGAAPREYTPAAAREHHVAG